MRSLSLLYRSDLPLLWVISLSLFVPRSSSALQNHPHPDRAVAVSSWPSHSNTLQLLYQGLCQSRVGYLIPLSQHAHTLTHSHTHTHTHTHMHTLAHAHTHTHMHTQHTLNMVMRMHRDFMGTLSFIITLSWHAYTCTCTDVTMVIGVWRWVCWNNRCQGWACFLKCCGWGIIPEPSLPPPLLPSLIVYALVRQS
jgi:hypothetical protein